MNLTQHVILGNAKNKLLKCFMISIAFLFSFSTQAKNYYFSSSSGNDSYSTTQAQSQSTPWKSISKLNSIFSTLVAGDVIYFKRGDTFYGSIVVNRSGSSSSPITLTAYGSGNRPVISGFSTLSTWNSLGNGVYQATTSGISNSVNLVTLNSQPQALGRYPNANASNGGYLNFESSSSRSITDQQLTSSTNWTGAELVVRKAKHVIERWPITSHSGSTITYSASGTIYPTTNNGFGYFIQKDARTLDQMGEWFYNTSSKYLQMYFGSANPSSYSVKVSTVDVLLNTSNYSNITVNELAFEGSNVSAINIGSSSYSSSKVTVTNCDIRSSGRNGIYGTNADYSNIQYCTVTNSLCNGIQFENEGGTSTYPTISHNTIKNAGSKKGMGGSSGVTYQGITAYATDATIEYNNLDSVGYMPIAFYYNNAKIRYNYISNYGFIKDDGGGIYTWTGAGGQVYSGREVKNNILVNGIGAGAGTPQGIATTYGIYMDDGVVGVDISGNSVANVSEAGIYIHNTHEVSVTNNTVYNCALNQVLFVHDNITPNSPLRNVTLKNNTLVAKTKSQLAFNMRTVDNDINQSGATDQNIYARPVDDNLVMGGLSSVVKTTYSLDGWKAAYTSKDANSKKSSKTVSPYKINALNTGNLVSNYDLLSSLSGYTLWSQNSNQSAAWDGSSKLTGSGSLRLSFPSSVTNIYSLITKTVGNVSSGKNYVLRFNTLGTTQMGSLRAYLRKSASPNTALVPVQLSSFGTSKKSHEFVFMAPTSDAASLVIEVQQNSGTTYLDDITFYEANVSTVNVDDQIRFEYNASTSTKTVNLGANYVGVDGTAYNGSITLQPYTSKVLLYGSGTIVTTPTTPTTGTLKASATASDISCFGSATTVAVTGSGGTAPYTGTGSFAVNAGKGALKISVPSPIANTYTLLYSSIGAISSSKTYVLRFSTLGTTSSGFLKASLRLTNTPWSTITPSQSKSFGTSRVDHEFVFVAPPTQSNASFQIELLQSSGTVYFDNIAFFESNSTGSELIGYNKYAYGQFESSISNITTFSGNKNHTASLDLSSKISSVFYFPVKDAKGDVRTTPAKIVQPSSALTINAKAGVLTSSGGVVSVTVSASGGTAPYTGTGVFNNIRLGTYTYTVKDSKGCSSSATVKVALNVGGRVATTNSVDTGAVGVSVVADSVTSEPAAKEALTISSYPNPSTTEFSLIVEGGSTEAVNVSVLSMDGRIVYNTQGTSNKRYTFGNNFINGMYIIRVMQGKTLQTLKVVKAK